MYVVPKNEPNLEPSTIFGKPAEATVNVPVSLLADLWRYGILDPVKGVVYGATHEERLAQANRILWECKP